MVGSSFDRSYTKGEVDRAGRRLRAGRRGELPTGKLAKEDLDAYFISEWWRRQHALPLAKVAANLRYYVNKFSEDRVEVSQRLKRYETVVDKLDRYEQMQLSRMEDIGGIRAVLPDQAAVDAILADLIRQPRWNIRRTREYIDGRTPGPKDDGYRAVHIIVVKDARFIEIQLRTWAQDRWAQAVEGDTRRLGERLKYGGGAEDLRKYYRMAAEFFAARENGLSVSDEFRREMSELYHATARYYESDS
jgi:ppGpp synthetase/RelA/SpoT-type nucleotidyltranferase